MFPRISCRTWWRWRTSCGFPYRKPHTRIWLMQRAGNPGRTSVHGPITTFFKCFCSMCHQNSGQSAVFLRENLSPQQRPGAPHPRFPVKLNGFRAPLAPFLEERRIRGPVQCSVQEIRGISLVFREMWDTTALDHKLFPFQIRYPRDDPNYAAAASRFCRRCNNATSS